MRRLDAAGGGEELGVAGVAAVAGAVQRDDEVVARAGGGDVQEAAAFVVVHLLVDRLDEVEVLGLHRGLELHRVPAVGRPEHLDAALAVRRGGHAGQDDDRELQALGGVDRHHADGVRVGLGQHRLGDARGLFALVGGPGEVRTQAAVLHLGPRPRLVDDEADPAPGVAGPRADRGDLEHSAVGDDLRRALRSGSASGRPCRCASSHAIASPTGWVSSASGMGAVRLNEPPERFQTNRSSSPQPNSGERRVVTSASWSLGSPRARAQASRSRTSAVW